MGVLYATDALGEEVQWVIRDVMGPVVTEPLRKEYIGATVGTNNTGEVSCACHLALLGIPVSPGPSKSVFLGINLVSSYVFS